VRTPKHYSLELKWSGATLLPLSGLSALSFHKKYFDICQSEIATGAEVGDQPGAQRRYIESPSFLDATYRFLKFTKTNHILSQYFKSQKLKINYIRARNPIRFEGKQKFHRDDSIFKSRMSSIECFVFMSDVSALSGGVEYAQNTMNGRLSVSPKNLKRQTANKGDLLLIKSQILHRGTTRFSDRCRWILSFQIDNC